MNRQAEVKKKIQNKFGKISRFCELTGLDYAITRRHLNRKTKNGLTEKREAQLAELERLAEQTENNGGLGKEITPRERSEIKKLIADKFRNETICHEKTGFSYVFINNLTSGRKKEKTKEVLDFINYLKTCKND